MREIKCYQCEICNKVHRHEKKAKECEERGKEIPLANVGDIFTRMVYIGGGYSYKENIKINKIIDKGHYLIYKYLIPDGKNWRKDSYRSEIWGNDDLKEIILDEIDK